MKRIVTGLALLALAGCVSGRGGTEGGPPLRDDTPLIRARAVPPPVLSLLGYRAQLELTPEQVAAIDSIGEWLFRANQEIVGELEGEYQEAERRRGIAIGGRRRLGGEEADTLVGEIAANNRAALAGLEGVLSAGQREQVCELARHSEELGRRRFAGRRPAPAVERRDSTRAISRGERVWPWCGAPPGPAPDSLRSGRAPRG